VQSGGMAMATRFLSIGLLFLLQVVLTRSLGLHGYGEFAYALSWANILTFIATVGTDRAALRFVAQYRVTAEYSLLRGFVRRSRQIGGIGSVALMAAMVALVVVLRGRLSPSELTVLLAASCVIPVLAQSTIGDCILLAIGRVNQGLASGVLRPAIAIGLMLAAGRFLGSNYSPAIAILLYGVAGAVCWGMTIYFIAHWLRQQNISSAREYRTRAWVAAAVPLMMVVLLNFMQNQSGIILSGLFLGTKQAGLFSAASRISEAVLFGFHSINAIAAPTFAAMHARGDHSRLGHFARLCAWGSTAIVLLCVAPLLFFGPTLMRLFGTEFVAAYPILLILLVNPIVMSVAGSVNFLLNMTGHQDLCLKVFAITTAVYLVLCMVLIPLWGTQGIALSNVLTTIMWNLTLLYCVRRHLGIWSCVGKL
jgi:O-antigen/teichoic acid export membrane protein